MRREACEAQREATRLAGRSLLPVSALTERFAKDLEPSGFACLF